MDEKTKEKNSAMGVDFQRLAYSVWNKLWIVVIAAVLSAVITFLGTFYLITPQYEASTMFYVNNSSSISVGGPSVSIESGDLVASKNLVESYIVILMTGESLNDVIDYAGVDLSCSRLEKMIAASAVNDTEIFRVVVTSPDPAEAKQIADAIAYILPKRIAGIIQGTTAKVVDHPVVPVDPSSPSYVQNTLIGFILGFALSVSVIVLRELFDITIRTEEDITQNCTHPVLASVPDMEAPSKGGYYYGYGRGRGGPKNAINGHNKKPVLVGGGVSFAASEAYKLLRTKLQFSFADDSDCRVIGVSSALTGEGKSLSSVNLAYALSQLNKRVLLIDCDMRRPSLTTNLPNIVKSPGLSDYLSGQSDFDELIQPCGIENEEDAFMVVAAGRNPPNPVELLSSGRMSRMLERLRQSYDYIVLDFPPVGEVSDALAVAQQTNGILLVARQDYCNRIVFRSAVRQFEFVGAKILGIVYNCATENAGAYGKKYYKKYHKKYAGNYATASRAVRKAARDNENS